MLILHLASGPVRGAKWTASRWQTWHGRRRIERLPAIRVVAKANYYRAFTAPNADYKATIYGAEDESVGTACYALSPLHDRVYLFDIRVHPQYQRRGYGTALLWYLARTYGQSITVITASATAFWSAARQLKDAGLVVTEPMSAGDMPVEAKRWQHLRADAERLEKVIAQRLRIDHEPWDIAASRGLESDG